MLLLKGSCLPDTILFGSLSISSVFFHPGNAEQSGSSFCLAQEEDLFSCCPVSLMWACLSCGSLAFSLFTSPNTFSFNLFLIFLAQTNVRVSQPGVSKAATVQALHADTHTHSLSCQPLSWLVAISVLPILGPSSSADAPPS